MNSAGDISPKTIEGIIDINLHEESTVFETLQELAQRFPNEGTEALRHRVMARIEEKARAGVVGFFLRKPLAVSSPGISAEEGLARLGRPETWAVNSDDALVAYEK